MGSKGLRYIANQLTAEGLDEIQRTVLCHYDKKHVALVGPPGVGKTQMIYSLEEAGFIAPIMDITCDEKMTESPLVGYPALEGNGSTRTVWKNAVLTGAMDEGKTFYGDEFSSLETSLQKRLNSAFDHRRKITRRDGVEIKAKPEFWAAISYNPKDHGKDLEESVSDRFEHIHFDNLPEEIEAKVALAKIGITTDVKVDVRGIVYNQKDKPHFYERVNDKWVDFFTKKQAKPGEIENIVEYEVATKRTGLNYTPKADLEKLAFQLSKFSAVVRSFAYYGTTQIDEKVKSNLTKLGEMTHWKFLHKPSPRTLQYALTEAKSLIDMGMPIEKAKEHAARLMVDQIACGSYREKSVQQDITVLDAVTKIAEALGLLPKQAQKSTFEDK